MEYQEKKDFRNTITCAKGRIENDVEEGSLEGRYDSRVSIFNLKNNFKETWKDSHELTHKGDMEVNINVEGE